MTKGIRVLNKEDKSLEREGNPSMGRESVCDRMVKGFEAALAMEREDVLLQGGVGERGTVGL